MFPDIDPSWIQRVPAEGMEVFPSGSLVQLHACKSFRIKEPTRTRLKGVPCFTETASIKQVTRDLNLGCSLAKEAAQQIHKDNGELLPCLTEIPALGAKVVVIVCSHHSTLRSSAVCRHHPTLPGSAVGRHYPTLRGSAVGRHSLFHLFQCL